MKDKTDNIGRRLDIPAEKWLELVAEFRKSGLTLKEFAESKEVNPNTFRCCTFFSLSTLKLLNLKNYIF
jgi:hypothetical protein